MNQPSCRRLVVLAVGISLAVVVMGLALAPAVPARPKMLSGQVVDVLDSETLVLLIGARRREIRLSGVEAPSTNQPGHLQAKQALARLALKRSVSVELHGTSPSEPGRAVVWHDGCCLNAEMIRGGYARDAAELFASKQLADAEQEARSQGRGLWARSRSDPAPRARYWLNTQTGVRHNDRCRHYGRTKSGRPCRADEGRACGECGG